MLHRLQTCKDMEDASEFADNITALTKEHHCATQLLQAFVKALCDEDSLSIVVEAARKNKSYSKAIFARPSHLTPELVSNLVDNQEQISAYHQINAEMVTRCLPVVSPANMGYWQRPSIKPVPLPPIELDVVFLLLKTERFSIGGADTWELKEALTKQLPAKFQKDSSTSGGPPSPPGSDKKCPAPPEPCPSEPKRPRVREPGKYKLTSLRTDAVALGHITGDKALMTPAGVAFHFPAIDEADSEEIRSLIDDDTVALRGLGFTEPLTPSITLTWNELLRTLGVKLAKKQVDALVAWIARVLAVKNPKMHATYL